jgi:hypothetical protein
MGYVIGQINWPSYALLFHACELTLKAYCLQYAPGVHLPNMAAHTKAGVGYNIHKLIIEQAVTNQVVDMGLLTQIAEPARQILDVETIDVVADRGHFKIEDIEACEKVGCIPHIPRPQRGSSSARAYFARTSFAETSDGRHAI